MLGNTALELDVFGVSLSALWLSHFRLLPQKILMPMRLRFQVTLLLWSHFSQTNVLLSAGLNLCRYCAVRRAGTYYAGGIRRTGSSCCHDGGTLCSLRG